LFYTRVGRPTPIRFGVSLVVSNRLETHCRTWSIEVGDRRFHCTGEIEGLGDQLTRRIRPGGIVLLHDDNRHLLVVINCFLRSVGERGDDLPTVVHLIE